MRVLVLVSMFALASCAQASREQAPDARTAAAVWLDGIALAHAQADQRGREDARQALELARARPVPPGVEADDARRVLQDLQFRLAALALQSEDPARAAAEAERGLSLGRAEDGFTANLLIAQARASAALGRHEAAASAYAAARALHARLVRSSD
jgi:hypothetical protein